MQIQYIITEGCEIPYEASDLAVGDYNYLDTSKPLEPQFEAAGIIPTTTTDTTDGRVDLNDLFVESENEPATPTVTETEPGDFTTSNPSGGSSGGPSSSTPSTNGTTSGTTSSNTPSATGTTSGTTSSSSNSTSSSSSSSNVVSWENYSTYEVKYPNRTYEELRNSLTVEEAVEIVNEFNRLTDVATLQAENDTLEYPPEVAAAEDIWSEALDAGLIEASLTDDLTEEEVADIFHQFGF